MNTLKQYSRWIVGTAALASALGLGIFGIAGASRDAGFDTGYETQGGYGEDHDSDDDDSEDRDRGLMSTPLSDESGAIAVYSEECGSCHVAYPPGLLPSTGWEAIMSGLDDHFGENAELSTDVAAQLTAFLDRTASDRGDQLNNARLLQRVTAQAPLRITGLPYFKREHDEIPPRMVKDNPKVKSFSNCDACHQDAARGRFDEDTVSIPGFGHWDD